MKNEKTIIYYKDEGYQYVISTTDTLEDAIEFVSERIIYDYYDGSIEEYIKDIIN